MCKGLISPLFYYYYTPFFFIVVVKNVMVQALWNLCFAKANKERIEKMKGQAKLQQVLEDSNDSELKRNIFGILYMFSKPEVSPDITYHLFHYLSLLYFISLIFVLFLFTNY